MKKQVIYTTLLIVTFAVLFSGCMQEPIFSAIEAEIKLEDAVVSGNVYSIVQSGNYLYAANGKIFQKNKTAIRGWEEISKQPAGYIIGLAVGRSSSGVDYLYALSSSEYSSSSTLDYTLYGSVVGSNNWQRISSYPFIFTRLFCNYAENDADKSAFIQSNYGVGILDALEIRYFLPPEIQKAAYLSSIMTTCFYTSKAFTSNQIDTLYKADKTDIISYSKDLGNTWNNVEIDGISSVFDLAYDSVQNKLIVGQTNGFYVVSLDIDGKPTGSKSTIGINSDATIGSNNVITVFASQGYYYAGSILKDNSKNNGLWGYYGANRNNEWNRE